MTSPPQPECIITDQNISDSMGALHLTEEQFIVCSVIIIATALIFVGMFIL